MIALVVTLNVLLLVANVWAWRLVYRTWLELKDSRAMHGEALAAIDAIRAAALARRGGQA